MTIFNQINNVSDDYTYIIDKSDIFYNYNELKNDSDSVVIYYYNTAEEEWMELSITENTYNAILDSVSNNEEIKPVLLDNNDDFLNLDFTQIMYHGIFSNQTNLPDDISENMYISLISISSDVLSEATQEISTDPSSSPVKNIVLIPIKSLLLSSQTQIWTPDQYEPKEKEYLSSKYTYNLLNEVGPGQTGTSIVTLSVRTSDVAQYGSDTSGTTLFSYFSNNDNVRNPNVIYKIRITYDEPLGTMGEYYLGNVITRFFIYANDGEGETFLSFGIEEEDISIMIDEKIGNIEEDMTS